MLAGGRRGWAQRSVRTAVYDRGVQADQTRSMRWNVSRVLTALGVVLALVSGHGAAAAKEKTPIPTAGHRKTLHTSFFVYLEKGAWTEKSLSSVEMGSRAGWTCKASDIELSEDSIPDDETHIYKSADIVCQSAAGAKIEMSALCDIGFENRGGSSARLYGPDGNFGVATIKCVTAYR